MNIDNRPIGVFDSGLGGLTSLKRIKALLPNENIIYFGDTARTPYGSKSIDTINQFSQQITEFLLMRDVKIIAIACNTVSAASLDTLKRNYPHIPFLGIIEPIVASLPGFIEENSTIAVIGTEVTIKSKTYEKAIRLRLPKVKVVSQACPLFVTLIEEGLHDAPVMDAHIRYYLDDFIAEYQPDYLILGCTHYPLIKHKIKSIYPGIILLDPAFSQAEKIEDLLVSLNLRADPEQKATYKFYASDLSTTFRQMIDTIMLDEQYSLKFTELRI